MKADARQSLVWGAKVLALFVLLGGFVGGAVTALVLFLWSMIMTPALESIPSFLTFLPMASLFGIVFGLPASTTTGWIYALSDRVRRAWFITAIGVATSAITGFGLPFVLAPSASATLEQSMYFAGVFAVAGGTAALACHAHISRWERP